jgi:hypothetical protein
LGESRDGWRTGFAVSLMLASIAGGCATEATQPLVEAAPLLEPAGIACRKATDGGPIEALAAPGE